MTPSTFVTYPGTVTEAENDRVPALRFSPGPSGYARFATREWFIPPVRVAGTLQITESVRSPGNRGLDGLHIHLGHAGNSRNYVASLVRRDRNMKVAVEYGWLGYQTLVGSWDASGPALVSGRTYHFDVTWTDSRIETWLASEAGVWTMTADIPDDRRIPAGAVGLRLDSLEAVGNFTVKQGGAP